MNKWQKYIAEIISLNSRGKHIEQAINFKGVGSHFSPTQVLEKLELAKQAQKLYQKAERITKLLLSVGEHSLTKDVSRIDLQLESSLRRIGDMISILNSKAEKFGIEEKPMDDLADVAQANDAFFDQDPDTLRLKIKSELKDLGKLLDYMEPHTLVKIYRDLKKINDL